MTADQSESVGPAIQELRSSQADVLMGGAVEPVAANPVLLVQLIGEAVEVGLRRHRVVEGSVEDRDLWRRGKEPPHRADPFQVQRIVQRSEGTEAFDLGHHIVRDECPFDESLAAMHDAMPHEADLAELTNDPRLLVRERGEHGLEGVLESARWQRTREVAPGRAVSQARSLDSDALNLSMGVSRFIRGVEEAVLDGGRPAVDDEDFLGPFPFELKPVRIAFPANGGRLQRIRKNPLHPFRNRARDVLHGRGLGHDHGLEE